MSTSCLALIVSNRGQVQSPGALIQLIPKYSHKNMGDWIKPAGCLMDSTSPPTHKQFQQMDLHKEEEEKDNRNTCPWGVVCKANHAHSLPFLEVGLVFFPQIFYTRLFAGIVCG